MEKQVKSNELKFRYTPICMLILVGLCMCSLVLVIAGLILYYSNFIMRAVHIDPYTIFGVILVSLFSIVVMIVAMTVPFIIAANITDLKGTAVFGEESFQLQFSRTKKTIKYADIKEVNYNSLPRKGPDIIAPIFRLQIKTAGKTVAFSSSSKEAWVNRKTKKKPQMAAVYHEILGHIY